MGIIWWSVVAWFAGCGASPEATDASPTPNEEDSGNPSSAEAPVVVDFGSSTRRLTAGESMEWVATVIDADGPDDLQGGSLRSADESALYGAFVDVGGGTFTVSTSWNDIHKAEGIEFGAGTQVVEVVAVFFDNQGATGRARGTVELYCEGDDLQGCDGRCYFISRAEAHCGGCNQACDKGQECHFSTCEAEWSECIALADDKEITCGDYCDARGEVCVPACDKSDASVTVYLDAVCMDLPGPEGNSDSCTRTLDDGDVASLKCCCTVGAVLPG